MTVDEEVFLYLLQDRIEMIRPYVKIDEDFQLKGRRFNSTSYVSEAIQGSIIMRKTPNIKGAVLTECLGLEFDPYQVESGKFDILIRTVLKHLATLDFESENRVDLS